MITSGEKTPRMFECKLKIWNHNLVLRKLLEKNLLWSNVISFVMLLVLCHIIDVKHDRILRKPTKEKIPMR